jgi:uncharacterized protein (TIGR02001 family)
MDQKKSKDSVIMQKYILSVFALGVAFAALVNPALAEDTQEPPSNPVAYNFGLVSDYVFRGITQTTHNPALQGGLDYEHNTGLYVGAWASNVRWIKDSGATATGDANVELDTYFGIKNAVANDYGYDFGYVRYNYLGTYTPQLGYNNADTSEVYGAASYKFVTLKYSYSLLDGFLTNPGAKGTNYIDLSANYPVEDAGMTVGAHIGKQTIVGAAADSAAFSPSSSYTDYKLSASKDFNSYVLSLSYTNTKGATSSFWNPGGDQWGRSTTSVSLIHQF